MRILKVHSYYTQPGGEDTVFRAESALLRANGHEVIEYLEYNQKIEGMNQAAVALQTLWSRPSYQKFQQFLYKNQPDIVHFHNTFPLISPSVYYACQELNLPVVQTLDNQRLICPASTFYRNGNLCLDCLGKVPAWPGVLHACYHASRLHTAVVASMVALHHWLGTWRTKVDSFLCSTHFYRNLFVQAGFPAKKIVVLPHFVQETPMPVFPKKDGEYALFIGRLDPEKGIKTLLEAWCQLDFPLKIRGEGRLEEWARGFVKQQDMDKIEFIRRLDEQGLSNLIGNARFLIMPSEGYYETFGMVIIESYSRCVPVVASNIGVVPELVPDKETGLLFEPGNAWDLAEKAEWMWRHPAEASKMGMQGLDSYRERFTENQCYQTLIGIYEGLVSLK
jgi:glycosyltransferase involved in cell wall biosynthesis